jgi:hypothetical protein
MTAPQRATVPTPVIRNLSREPATSWLRVIPAWIISGAAHAVMLAVFLLFSVALSTARVLEADIEPILDAQVQNLDTSQDPTLPDPGFDPNQGINFKELPLGPVSVSGFADPTEPPGLPDAPEEAVRTNIPPPPGFGGENGGGVGGPGGHANLRDQPGGRNGPRIAIGFKGRVGITREMVEAAGGNAKSEAAVAAGLLWLALHQADDGRWSLDSFHQHAHDKIGPGAKGFTDSCDGQGARGYDVAATAFGLLPFLGAGKTHKPAPDGTKETYNYTKTVEAGLKYLLAKQGKDGEFPGGMYSHGLATICVCEAYGLTSDPVLKAPAQHAIDFIVKAQDPAGGGWRYAPRQSGDTSVVGWQVMALKSGQMSGLSVPVATLKGAEKWLDNNASADYGDYGYIGAPNTTKDSPASAMTAVGLLCRQYLGWSPRNVGLLNGVSRLKRVPPGATNNMYYYYYATQVMHHMGGEAWESWNPKMRDQLIDKQDQGNTPGKPHQVGSWDPKGEVHGPVGGRVMITSLSLLTLEVYYRHLPLYRRDMGLMKEFNEGDR